MFMIRKNKTIRNEKDKSNELILFTKRFENII